MIGITLDNHKLLKCSVFIPLSCAIKRSRQRQDIKVKRTAWEENPLMHREVQTLTVYLFSVRNEVFPFSESGADSIPSIKTVELTQKSIPACQLLSLVLIATCASHYQAASHTLVLTLESVFSKPVTVCSGIDLK